MVWCSARKDQIMVVLRCAAEADACYSCVLVTRLQSRGMLQFWMLWSAYAKVRVRFPWLQFVALLHCRAHVTDLWIRGMLEPALWISSEAQAHLCNRAFASLVKRFIQQCSSVAYYGFQVICWEKGKIMIKGNDDKDTDCNMKVKERVGV